MEKNSTKMRIITAIILVVFLLMSILPFLPASFWGGSDTTTYEVEIPSGEGDHTITLEDLENGTTIQTIPSDSESSETEEDSEETEVEKSETETSETETSEETETVDEAVTAEEPTQ